MTESLALNLRNMSLSSGVYLMKDTKGNVIYVGKAVSLRKRVQSYFRRSSDVRIKTDLLVSDIVSIETIETASEAEALILEASLIKQYDPRYNVVLKDDKTYPFIEITNEKFPKVSVERPRVKNPESMYFGPYVNPALIREALTIIRKIFHFRTCHPMPLKDCLDYHIGLCDAPCIGKINTKEYAKNLHRVRLILEGKKDTLYRQLKNEMDDFSSSKNFEAAAKVRDQLQAIGALYSGTRDVNYYKEIEQLERSLSLPRRPERIEAFDISNIMGQHAVGSMVSFLNGRPDKKNYRRFRIKTVKGIDDFQMIAEVVMRRYTRLKKENKTFPDLILIDGGKGQLKMASGQLKELKIDIPIISLAKREEEVFLPNKKMSIKLSKESLALRLLQRVRDEAHRFAVSYHRLLRGKAALE